MSSLPPPPKKFKSFSIRDILNLPDQAGTGNSSSAIDKYIERMGAIGVFNAKFKLIKSKSKFSIKDVPENPEGLLAQIFQQCIDDTINEAKEKSLEPDQVGVSISSNLLDPDIWIPIRDITLNSTENILNRFLLVAQSKTKEGSLWGEPFTVTVTACSKKGLTNANLSCSGSGAHNISLVKHAVNKNSLLRVLNSDSYCLFYALQLTFMHSTKMMEVWKFFRYLHGLYGQKGSLAADTLELMQANKIPLGLKNYDATIYAPQIIDYWNNHFKGKFTFKLFIFSQVGHYKPYFKYGPENFTTPIILYHSKNHFDGVKSIAALFERNNYCLSCETPFHCVRKHRKSCRNRCLNCSQYNVGSFPCPDTPNFNRYCSSCKKTFKSLSCYQYHLANQTCLHSKKCDACGKIYDVDVNSRDGRASHSCSERYCFVCRIFHSKERGCYIRPLKPKIYSPTRIVVFDFETVQNRDVDPMFLPGRKWHIVNFAAAKIVCDDCIRENRWNESLLKKPCQICGPHRTITFSHKPFFLTKVDMQVCAANPLRTFVNWILYQLPKKYTTIAFSHFGGRFDMVLTFREIFKMGHTPKMIRRGNKMYEMTVPKTAKNSEVVFRDTFNLMPMSLESLVGAFGLEDVDSKQFFPHLYNIPSNYGITLPHLPDKSMYLYGGMLPEKKQRFDQYYEDHKHEPFNLNEKLAEYAKSDVDILCSALIAFQSEFFEITKREPSNGFKGHSGINILKDAMTIASACMKHFKLNHLRPNHIAITPEKGYDSMETQSLLALKFLRWYGIKNKVNIQTALSPEGEKNIGSFKLDGFIDGSQLDGNSVGIECFGCAWHGCKFHYPDDNFLLPNGKTAGKIREDDAKRLEYIKKFVPKIEIYWECEIMDMLSHDPEMKLAFDNYLDEGPLNLRSCYFGGRTGARKLFHAVKKGEKISYVDFCSLYPFTNWITKYPIGHPKVHIINKDVLWQNPNDNPYKIALIKAFVIPPRNIDIPILPAKFDDRLLFPCCRTCSMKYPNGSVIHDYSCNHTDMERGWVTTATSIEIDESLAHGYKIIKLMRVLEFEESDDTLFKNYISEFMSMKIHASGFPSDLKTTEEQNRFILECHEKFGIQIERQKMVPNKAKRLLSKLMNNNLWGRFSLRNKLTKTHITNSPAELCVFLGDRRIQINSIDEITDEVILISYEPKEDFVEEHDCSNIIISLWTTSMARIFLFRAMQKVAKTPGCEIFYHDTDSIIYLHPEDSNPLETGPHLGDLTDEFPDHKIVEFVSGGSKQYGLKLVRNGSQNKEFEYILKLRGITLNYDVINSGLCYESFKNRVLKYSETGRIDEITVKYPNFIRPDIRSGTVISAPMTKIYKPYVGKGIIVRDHYVKDFGHVSPS